MDYVEDLALLVNKSVQAESLLHSLEQAANEIGLYVNANKTEVICFKEDKNHLYFKWQALKLVDQFTYLGGNMSSTESDLNIRIAKAWIAIDRLSTVWKSDLSN